MTHIQFAGIHFVPHVLCSGSQAATVDLQALLDMATTGNGTAPGKDASMLMANQRSQSAKARMSFRDDRDLEGQIKDQELKVRGWLFWGMWASVSSCLGQMASRQRRFIMIKLNAVSWT